MYVRSSKGMGRFYVQKQERGPVPSAGGGVSWAGDSGRVMLDGAFGRSDPRGISRIRSLKNDDSLALACGADGASDVGSG